MNTLTQIERPAAMRQFALSGKAKFVLEGERDQFVYKVKACEGKRGLYFVSVLVGDDDWKNYQYIGVIRDRAWEYGAKAKLDSEASSVVAFQWFWRRALSGDTGPLKFWAA